MKKNLRHVGVMLLLAIYCFAVGLTTNTFIRHEVQSTLATEQEKHYESFSSILYCPISESENLHNSSPNFPTSSDKKPFNGFWPFSKSTETLIERAFSQYTFSARNFLLRHRKSNLIFPFHSFW